jgi:hypothetical protein
MILVFAAAIAVVQIFTALRAQAKAIVRAKVAERKTKH